MIRTLFSVMVMAVLSTDVMAGPKSVSVPAKMLTVSRGSLEFADLALWPEDESVKVAGRVINRTDRYIFEARFNVQIKDRKGSVMPVSGLATTKIENVMPGGDTSLPMFGEGIEF